MVSQPAATQQYRDVRAFVAAQAAFSETAISLANKLDINVGVARQVLNGLAETGDVERRSFEQRIEPMYYHYSQGRGR